MPQVLFCLLALVCSSVQARIAYPQCPNGLQPIAAQLGGQTLTPGCYYSVCHPLSFARRSRFSCRSLHLASRATSFSLATVLTTSALKARSPRPPPGEPFRFLLLSIRALSSNVILQNGALCTDVTWLTFAATTTGASSTLVGAVYAGGAITLGASSSLQGAVTSDAAITYGELACLCLC